MGTILGQIKEQLKERWFLVLLIIAHIISLAMLIPHSQNFLGHNDKSRWLTIKALVHDGTYSIGEFRGTKEEPIYYGYLNYPDYISVDIVMNPKTNLFYSSKPPLLPTLVAGQYWLLKKTLGWDLDRDRSAIVMSVCLIWNVLPYFLFLFLFSSLLKQMKVSREAYYFLLCVAAFGTYLGSSFRGTLNNHLPAAFAIFYASYCFLQLWLFEKIKARYFFAAGLCSAFAAVTDLPALSLALSFFVLFLFINIRKTLLYFLPPVLLIALVHLGMTYQITGGFKPIYLMHNWYLFPGAYWANPKGVDAYREAKTIYLFHNTVGMMGLFSMTPVYLLSIYASFLAMKERMKSSLLLLTGFIITFITHLLLKIQLPRWLAFLAAGFLAIAFFFPRKKPKSKEERFKIYQRLTFLVLIANFCFYISRTSDYGGLTYGPRWTFWLSGPLLISMIPVVQSLLSRGLLGRISASSLLAFSALSAFSDASAWSWSWLFKIYNWREEYSVWQILQMHQKGIYFALFLSLGFAVMLMTNRNARTRFQEKL